MPWIALHGWLDNCGTFGPLTALLPPGLRLLAPDLPGHWSARCRAGAGAGALLEEARGERLCCSLPVRAPGLNRHQCALLPRPSPARPRLRPLLVCKSESVSGQAAGRVMFCNLVLVPDWEM